MKKPTKHVLKIPIHMTIVAILSISFVFLNKKQIIGEHTEIPWSIEKILDFSISIRGLYVWFIALILLAIVHKFLDGNLGARCLARKGFYLSLSLFTAKLYTISSIFFAYYYISKEVGYVGQLPGTILFGFMSMFLGLITWHGGRYLAISLWSSKLGS